MLFLVTISITVQPTMFLTVKQMTHRQANLKSWYPWDVWQYVPDKVTNGNPVFTLAGCYLIAPTAFVEETQPFPWISFSSLVKDELAVHIWTHFCHFFSALLIFFSVSVPLQNCFDYHCPVVRFEDGSCDSLSFIFNLHDCFGYSLSLVFSGEFVYYIFDFWEGFGFCLG